jgi:hypothetical protein
MAFREIRRVELNGVSGAMRLRPPGAGLPRQNVVGSNLVSRSTFGRSGLSRRHTYQ